MYSIIHTLPKTNIASEKIVLGRRSWNLLGFSISSGDRDTEPFPKKKRVVTPKTLSTWKADLNLHPPGATNIAGARNIPILHRKYIHSKNRGHFPACYVRWAFCVAVFHQVANACMAKDPITTGHGGHIIPWFRVAPTPQVVAQRRSTKFCWKRGSLRLWRFRVGKRWPYVFFWKN